jgi:hypothetical protein
VSFISSIGLNPGARAWRIASDFAATVRLFRYQCGEIIWPD